MSIPFKKDPVEFNQSLLFPSNLFDLLPADHECYIYEDIFKQIDTSSIEKKYSVLGQNAYHPRLNISILIYAYSHGIFSSRQIKKRCHEDLGFMFISHLHCPDFRVLSDFRKEHYEYFKACFKQSVLLAMEAGMTSFGHVSLDGSKFKANTSRHKAMSYGRLQERKKALTEEIEALVKKAEQGDRARIMGKKGGFPYAYNGQITVDKDHQIILGQHITQKANDKQEVKPALQEIKDTTGKLPDRMSLDNNQAQSGDCHGCSCRDMCCKSKDGSGRTITTDDKEPLRLGEFSDGLLAQV